MIGRRRTILALPLLMSLGCAVAPPRPGDSCVFPPTLDAVIQPGHNTVYCATVQLAWDAARGKDPILLEGRPPTAEALNAGRFDPDNLEPGTYGIFTGIGHENYAKAVREISERFFDLPDAFQEAPQSVDPNAPLLYALAVLDASLRFQTAFHVYSTPLHFEAAGTDRTVRAFGIGPWQEGASEEARKISRSRWLQINVPDYRNEDDFVVTLKAVSGKSAGDDPKPWEHEIIIAQIPPRRTLGDTWEDARKRCSEKQTYDRPPTEYVKIPCLQFDVTKDFPEVANRRILNSEWSDAEVVQLLQWVNFKLDETGVTLKSAAELVGRGAGGIEYIPPVRRIAVDKPFLLALRLPGKEPYLVAWIGNLDFLVAAPGTGENAYSGGRNEAVERTKQSSLALLVRSEPESWQSCERIRRRVMREKFGIEIRVATGYSDEALDEHIRGYNDVMMKAILEARGPDVFEKIEAIVGRACMGSEQAALDWLLEARGENDLWGESPDTKTFLSGLVCLALVNGERDRSRLQGPFKALVQLPMPSGNPQADAMIAAALCRLHAFYGARAGIPIAHAQPWFRQILEKPEESGTWNVLALYAAGETDVVTEDEWNTARQSFLDRIKERTAKQPPQGDEIPSLDDLLALQLLDTQAPDEDAMKLAERLTLDAHGSLRLLHLESAVARQGLRGDDRKRLDELRRTIEEMQDPSGYWECGDPAEKALFPEADARVYATAMTLLVECALNGSFPRRPALQRPPPTGD